MLKKTGDVIYFGIDESNHGKFPEVFVAVASYNYQDSLIVENSRRIRRENQLFSSMKIRDYRYSVVTKEEYDKYCGKNIMPLVSSGLIKSFAADYDFSKGYIDGELKSFQKSFIENLVGEDVGKRIIIEDLPKGKNRSTNYLVELADGWANWIVKKMKKGIVTEGMRKRRINFI